MCVGERIPSGTVDQPLENAVAIRLFSWFVAVGHLRCRLSSLRMDSCRGLSFRNTSVATTASVALWSLSIFEFLGMYDSWQIGRANRSQRNGAPRWTYDPSTCRKLCEEHCYWYPFYHLGHSRREISVLLSVQTLCKIAFSSERTDLSLLLVLNVQSQSLNSFHRVFHTV